MSDFDFLFSFFGLLLGFVLIEALSGLVRTLQFEKSSGGQRQKMGWLTPLLAVFVVLDVASYWWNLWTIREHLPVGMDTLLGGVLIVGAYYFAASMVFPKNDADRQDLDVWFWRHKRLVLGVILVVNLAFVIFYKTVGSRWGDVGRTVLIQGAYFIPLIAATLSRNRHVVGVSIALIILLYLALAAEQFVGRFA